MSAAAVTIVTGGGGNIGRGICRALANAGAIPIAVDRRPPRADAAARHITCDVTDPAARAATVAEVVAEFGGVDTLINVAQGFRTGIPMTEITDEDMRYSFESGPIATRRMMQLCYPHMKERGGGAMINFGSGAGTHGGVGTGAYAAAKEAIRAITKVASVEWGPDNIRVNVICPLAETDLDAKWIPKALPTVPLNRIGDPEKDIGSLVLYLASPTCYMTGRTLMVDGGYGTFR